MLSSNLPPNTDDFDDDDYPRTVSELQQWILDNWASLSGEQRAELFLAICEARGMSVNEGLRRIGVLPPDDSERRLIELKREAANDPHLALGWRWVENHVYAGVVDDYPDERVNEDWRQAAACWSAG